MRPWRILLVVSLLCGAATSARAQYDLVGVRALGAGEAMRAIATGAEGPLLNPAGMSLIKQYVIEAQYGFTVEPLQHAVNVSVVDSVTSRVAAGLFYSFIYGTPHLGFNWAGGTVRSEQITRTGHAAGLSLSIPLGDRFIIGATIKYLHFDTTGPLPMGTVPSSITFDSVNGVTFDVGLLVRLGEKFNIAAVGYNLWDHGSRESPLSLGLAISFIPIRALSISFDALTNFTGFRTYTFDPMTGQSKTSIRVTARLGPGLEWLIANKVPLRLGLVYDEGLSAKNPALYLTGGLGYVATSFGIDLGYRGKVSGGIENTLMLGVRIFVD
jgi:hypothetical protein